MFMCVEDGNAVTKYNVHVVIGRGTGLLLLYITREEIDEGKE